MKRQLLIWIWGALSLAGCHAQSPPEEPLRTGAEMFVQFINNPLPSQMDWWQSLMAPDSRVAVVANQALHRQEARTWMAFKPRLTRLLSFLAN